MLAVHSPFHGAWSVVIGMHLSFSVELSHYICCNNRSVVVMGFVYVRPASRTSALGPVTVRCMKNSHNTRNFLRRLGLSQCDCTTQVRQELSTRHGLEVVERAEFSPSPSGGECIVEYFFLQAGDCLMFCFSNDQRLFLAFVTANMISRLSQPHVRVLVITPKHVLPSCRGEHK